MKKGMATSIGVGSVVRDTIVIILRKIQRRRRANTDQVLLNRRVFGFVPGGRERSQNNTGQQRDNRDDDKQLNKSKALHGFIYFPLHYPQYISEQFV